MKDPENDARPEVAPVRYGVIAETLHLPKGEVAAALARLSGRDREIPGSKRSRIAVQTMRDWRRRHAGPAMKG